MNDCACEAKRPATIYEIAQRNRMMAEEINIGMDKLLEILIGPENAESCDVVKQPNCLQSEVMNQNISLGQIHAKLNRAYAVLNEI